ncbi:hypothetical protein [Vibrio nomapromontoriensis]|uniref:hypothetical protein n=1 Tax=Vibrio nomapromontoriensis TaxID=2910246 RepID=UPI003D13BDBA
MSLIISTNVDAISIEVISTQDRQTVTNEFVDALELQSLIDETCYQFSPKGCEETGAFVIQSDTPILEIESGNTQALAVISGKRDDRLTRLSCVRTKPEADTIIAGCPTTVQSDNEYMWEAQDSQAEFEEYLHDRVVVIPLNIKGEREQTTQPSITATNIDGESSEAYMEIQVGKVEILVDGKKTDRISVVLDPFNFNGKLTSGKAQKIATLTAVGSSSRRYHARLFSDGRPTIKFHGLNVTKGDTAVLESKDCRKSTSCFHMVVSALELLDTPQHRLDMAWVEFINNTLPIFIWPGWYGEQSEIEAGHYDLREGFSIRVEEII